MMLVLCMGTLKGLVSPSFVIDPFLKSKQSNILVSNDTPPRARLADFSLITTILDPDQKLSRSAQVAGGTTKFKSPELLVPEMSGKKGAYPTPQSDIYALGLVIFQVCQRICSYQLFSCVLSPGP